MKRIIIILLISISISHSNEWEMVYKTKYRPNDVVVLDTNKVYIVSTIGLSNSLHLYNTKEDTVKLIYKDWKNSDNCKTLSVPDSNNIYIGFSPPLIQYTSDGGKSFNRIKFDKQEYFHPIQHLNMLNNEIGIMTNHSIVMTKNNWNSYKKYYFSSNEFYGSIMYPIFINDSTIYCIVRDYSKSPLNIYLLKFNIYSFDYELLSIEDNLHDIGIRDFCIVNENLMFVCGQSHGITGGSGRDAIYKTTDGGKNWRRVLDLYTDDERGHLGSPFTIQSIAFKDSLRGIATGQFRKILYTYDGGESWTYETDLNETYKDNNPPTSIIRYAGQTPIMATFSGHIYKMTEDTYAPKAEDIYTVSGRVWELDTGQANIPVALNNRVTMTNSNGNYQFTNVALGSYKLTVFNKYFDGDNDYYYYKPYSYSPEQYDLILSGDTTGLDFNATDLRTYHSLGGTIKDEQGNPLAGIEVQANISTTFTDATNKMTYTDSSGYYEYPKLEQWYYTFKPVSDKWQFDPEEIGVRLKFSADDADFNASLIPEDTNKYYSVSGKIIRNGELLPNYEFELGDEKVYSNLDGVYKFDKVKAGQITVTPTFYLYNDNIYVPENYTINLISDTTGLDFEITNSTGVFDSPPNRVYISNGILYCSDNLLGINSRLFVSDLTGRILHQSQVRPQIDMRHFPPGLYFIAIITERGSKRIWKVVR